MHLFDLMEAIRGAAPKRCQHEIEHSETTMVYIGYAKLRFYYECSVCGGIKDRG